jgi:exopolysaccharide production protein ExoY
MLNIAHSGDVTGAEVNGEAAVETAGLDVRRAANRGMNVSIAVIALLFFLPLMILVALAIWCQDRGPIFFAHRRIGRDGRKFPCLKFRSMATDAQERLQELLAKDPQARAEWERDHKLRHDPRVTSLGAFLRKTSLDELPQLINVIRGEMDLVGPRPIVDGEVCKYGARFKHYCSVNPGITGLWQVSGRNDTSYRSRVAMDCVYARSKSLRMDLWIMIATVPAVLLRKGSY